MDTDNSQTVSNVKFILSREFGDWNLNIVGYGPLSLQMMLKYLSQSNEWSHGIIMNIDSNYHRMQNLHTTFLALDDWLGSFSKPELLLIVLM